jgi:hypothetical protein
MQIGRIFKAVTQAVLANKVVCPVPKYGVQFPPKLKISFSTPKFAFSTPKFAF